MKRKIIDSPIGRLLLGADDAGICMIRLLNPEEKVDEEHTCALLEQAAQELSEYFAGSRKAFGFPISLHGTPFERAVWQALCGIPFGETRTYGQIAAQLGMPKGARAVGSACSRNPVLIAVPCHREIAASGALTGFAAGMPAKRTLLALEGFEMDHDRLKQ